MLQCMLCPSDSTVCATSMDLVKAARMPLSLKACMDSFEGEKVKDACSTIDEKSKPVKRPEAFAGEIVYPKVCGRICRTVASPELLLLRDYFCAALEKHLRATKRRRLVLEVEGHGWYVVCAWKAGVGTFPFRAVLNAADLTLEDDGESLLQMRRLPFATVPPRADTEKSRFGTFFRKPFTDSHTGRFHHLTEDEFVSDILLGSGVLANEFVAQVKAYTLRRKGMDTWVLHEDRVAVFCLRRAWLQPKLSRPRRQPRRRQALQLTFLPQLHLGALHILLLLATRVGSSRLPHVETFMFGSCLNSYVCIYMFSYVYLSL